MGSLFCCTERLTQIEKQTDRQKETFSWTDTVNRQTFVQKHVKGCNTETYLPMLYIFGVCGF